MDALRHPDLVALGHRLRRSFDRAAAAELEVARLVHARARDLRELLIEWEDAGRRVRLTTRRATHGPVRIRAVGTDHLVLGADGTSLVVPFHSIVSVEDTA